MKYVALALALLTGCGTSDPQGAGGSGGGPAETWSVVIDGEASAFYSAWAPSDREVWVVGTDVGQGPSVLRFDGSAWERLDTGTEGSLRWIHGFPGGAVLVGGDGGRVLRTTDGSSFQSISTPGTGTVWGVWGATEDDVWAVGGDPGGGTGFAWRRRGDAFEEVPGFAEAAAGQAAFKVWGRSADDVWIVGTGGLMLHWDGESFAPQGVGVIPTDIDLRTVHGDATQVIAVGGYANGFAALSDGGGTWTRGFAADAIAPAFNGTFVTAGRAFVVGMEGYVASRSDGRWAFEADGLTRRGLHAVAVDPQGGAWAVGGRLTSDVDGTVLHRGGKVPGTIR